MHLNTKLVKGLNMEDALCKEKHRSIDTELKRQSDWINEHEKKIDTLVRSDAVNTTALENLCKQIGGQTKAIWGLVSSILMMLTGFFLWYVQNK